MGQQCSATAIFMAAFWLLAVSQPKATDFHVLIAQQTPAERLADPPVGTVLINGGYEHGLIEEQTGTVWQEGTLESGSIEVGTATVQSTSASEATCSVILNEDFRFITLDHRVSMEPVPDESAGILERGEAAFSDADFERALFYFEKLWWVHQDNPLITSRTETCRQLVDSARAAGLSESEKQREVNRLDRYVRIAHRYIKLHDLPMADRYLERLLSIDSTHQKVRALQLIVPDEDVFAALRTDCFPMPPYNDSTASIYEARSYKLLLDQIAPMTLLGVTCDSSRYALLIDRRGTLSRVITPVSSGSKRADWTVIRIFARTKFDPLLENGEPTCTWVNYEVEFPQPPRDLLLAAHLESSLNSYTGLENAFLFEIFFFKFLRTPLCGYRSFFAPQTDSAAMQRTVDSILYDRWPEAFESKTWKKLKDKPKYVKKWKKNSKKRR